MEKKPYFKCTQDTYMYDTPGKTTYKIMKREMYSRGKCFFDTKEEAISDYEKAEKLALAKYEKFLEGISSLKKSIGNFHFDYEQQAGDDVGVEIFNYVLFPVNGYDFRFPIR